MITREAENMAIRLSLPTGSKLRFQIELGPNGLDRRSTANDRLPLTAETEPAFYRRATDHVTLRNGAGETPAGVYDSLGGYLA